MQSWFSSSEGSGVSDHPPTLNSTEGTNKLYEPGVSPGCVFDKRMVHPKELFHLSKYRAAGSACHIGLQSLQSLKQGLSKKKTYLKEKKNKTKTFATPMSSGRNRVIRKWLSFKTENSSHRSRENCTMQTL